MCWTFHLPMCWASPLTDVLNPHPCFPCSAEKDNCWLLISNSSFPQGRINPPIRGPIVAPSMAHISNFASQFNMSQSPYKGFNSGKPTSLVKVATMYQSPDKGLNSRARGVRAITMNSKSQSPYKGFNSGFIIEDYEGRKYQSPYKGFNRWQVGKWVALMMVSIPL